MLLAGCAQQKVSNLDTRSVSPAELFALANIGGKSIAVGVSENSISRLFDLGLAATNINWARWSMTPEGAVLALVEANGDTGYWFVDRAKQSMEQLPGTSDAGDAVASGKRIWEIGPGPHLSTRTFTNQARKTSMLPLAVPTRLTVSDDRVFVLGQTENGTAVACEVSESARVISETHFPRKGVIADLTVVGSNLCASVVPDVTATGSDQTSEVLILAPGGLVIARRSFENPSLTAAVHDGVVIADSRADGRHLVAIDPHGRLLWDHKLPAASPVLALAVTPNQRAVFAVQNDAVTVVTSAGVRTLHSPGEILSQG